MCDDYREEAIRQIKYIGESLVDISEEIVGNDASQILFPITISFEIDPREKIPIIDVSKNLIPKMFGQDNDKAKHFYTKEEK